MKHATKVNIAGWIYVMPFLIAIALIIAFLASLICYSPTRYFGIFLTVLLVGAIAWNKARNFLEDNGEL
jgi:hypothetical protein